MFVTLVIVAWVALVIGIMIGLALKSVLEAQ